jgi:hypothetical protein
LTGDLQWRAAGELRVGDRLTAFSEESDGVKGRRWEKASVTYAGVKDAETIELKLADGSKVFATPEHRLLAHGGHNNSVARWISAQEFLDHAQNERANYAPWTVDKFVDVWEHDTSYESGYLAAAFDGEGSLSAGNDERANIQLTFCQTQNDMLETTKRYLAHLGFEWSESWAQEGENKPRCLLYIYGFAQIARFLGVVRPKRLLAKWLNLDIGRKFFYRTATVDVVAARPGGTRKIAMLSSSSKTYISAGFASHNTNYDWSIYCNLARYFRKDKNIHIDVPNGADAFFDSYGVRYMLTHGDSLGVKGGDGIIGAIGPIMRGTIKLGRQTHQIGMDFDELILCHWHQMLWLPNVTVNNSLKGYDEYVALGLRAPYSRPSQALFFNHPEHGTTARWEIFLEGKQQAKAAAAPWVSWQNP